MRKIFLLFLFILIAGIVGIGLGYYFGYDHGWENMMGKGSFADQIGNLNVNKNDRLQSNINYFMESKVSDNYLRKDNYHCGNILYGYDDKYAYAWVYCSGFIVTGTEELKQGTAFSTPTRLEFTKPNFEIIDYKQPGMGNQYGPTLRLLFPKKFYDIGHPSNTEINRLEDELRNKAKTKVE